MTFKDSIWKENILNTNVTTNILFKRLKALEGIFDTSRKLEKKTSNIYKSFIAQAWNFTWNLQAGEELFLTHLKLDTFNNSKTSFLHTSNFQWIKELSSTRFLKIQNWNYQQLKNLSSKHFHLTTCYFQKLKERVFHTWKTYNTLKKFLPHLPLTWKCYKLLICHHLEMDSHFLCILAN